MQGYQANTQMSKRYKRSLTWVMCICCFIQSYYIIHIVVNKMHNVNFVKLYPNKVQQQTMRQTMGACRWVWNWGLTQREIRRKSNMSTGPYDLHNMLPALKELPETAWLNKPIAATLQQTLNQQNSAFTRFYKRQNKYPRFKSKGTKNSFTLPQHSKIVDERHIKLLKVGILKMRGFQPRWLYLPLKSVTISLCANQWYAALYFGEQQVTCVSNPGGTIGVDLGVTHLATVHDGEKAVHYHHNTEAVRKSEERIKLYQRKMLRCEKGSKNREKWRIKFQKEHAHLRNIRKDTLHKLSRKLVDENSLIVLESLQIGNMLKSASGTKEKPGKNIAQKRGLNRAISRQGWGMLARMLSYKAQQTGCKIALVDPKYTSQTCPKCKHRAAENRLTQAKFVCVNCGYSDNADAVAAFNIKGISQLAKS